MLGLVYLFLNFTVGWAICSYAFIDLDKIAETAYDKRKISISPYLLKLPVWYITGTLAMTWAVYVIATLADKLRHPLSVADAVVIPLSLLFTAFVYYRKVIKGQHKQTLFFTEDRRARNTELLLIAAVAVLASVLMWTTFYVKYGQLHIGVSVFSDFSPHIGMIRSFSYGNNFPTEYSHFAGEDIKYHFMFMFLTGNLEYLGLRLDYAFNIPSILSFISAFLLLYILAVKITGKTFAGILACLFFAFRSSKTLFTYLSQLPEKTNIIKTLADNTSFISSTPNEDWGLWNLNVYCNQRHLAFGLAVMFFIIILFLPQLYEMFEAVKQYGFDRRAADKKASDVKGRHGYQRGKGFIRYFKLIFLSKEGWKVKDLRLPVAAGVMLGSLAFFHGSAEIGCLLVLFVAAILARRRMEYVIMVVIALLLTFLQTRYFIHGSSFSTKFLFGFIAENKTVFGALSYLDRLLGVLPFVLLAAFCIEKGIGRYLMLAFTAPLIFAFTVSMTVDVTVNHKYIMMSCIMLGIFAAALLMKLFERKDIFKWLAGILIIVMLTSTGIYDFYTVINKNTSEMPITLNMNDPLTNFVRDHSDSKDIYLTASYTINQVVFGGAMLYQGHQYYAWSAGYDTFYRDGQVKLMYEAQTPQELDSLVKENNIRYIIVDKENRDSTDYTVNEDNISASYECVYSGGSGEWKTSIYDTKLPLF